MDNHRIAALAIASLVIAAGCGTVASSTPLVSQAGPTVAARSSPETAPTEGADSSAARRATAACSAILGDIPMVTSESAKTATLAAAYEVTGDQLLTYLENARGQSGYGEPLTTWQRQPNKVVNMCLFDGEFETMTPGPPEADRSAVRVLVLIADGDALLWTIARKDRSLLPATNPAAQ